MEPLLTVIALVWGLCAIFAAVIANWRHTSPAAAFILGLLLGPFGVILAAVQKPPQPVKWDR